jgi:hypothetical protein
MKNSVGPPHPQEYVRAVLTWYLELPETPLRPSAQDRNHALQLQLRGVPLTVIESAFLLASLRRLARNPSGNLGLSSDSSRGVSRGVVCALHPLHPSWLGTGEESNPND